MPAGCHDFQRFLQGQSRQVTQGVQGVTFGSRRQWSHGLGILARPAVSRGYHGLYCTYCSRTQGRWGSREDNVIRDTEHQLFHFQAPYGQTDLSQRNLQAQDPQRCPVCSKTSRGDRLQRYQGSFIVPDVPTYVSRYGGVGQEVSNLCVTRRLHGGICHRGSFSQVRENEAAEGEVSHHPGSPGLSRFCIRFQSPAVAPWCLVEELRVPASGPFNREDGTVRGFACSGSRAQGPSEQSENHQTGGQDGWVFSHVRPETLWFQVQHKSDVIQEDYIKGISLRSSGVSYCHHDPENSDSGAALSRWRRQGSPPPTLPRGSEEALAESAGNCRATGIVKDGVDIAFQQRPQLTHQCISFRTRNSRQDLQQAVDALLLKGAIERVTNVTSPGYYSRLFLVPKKTGDLRPVIDPSTLNRHMVVPHLKMETQGSVRSAIRSQEWTVSIDIRDAYLHVPMHQAVRKYLRFVVYKKV